MFRFALLLLVLSSSIVCAWLDRKHLLRGQGVRVALTLLLCVLFVPLLLFLVFSAVAYSFRGAAFEMTMTVLIAALGLGCVIWGAVIKTRAAIVLLVAVGRRGGTCDPVPGVAGSTVGRLSGAAHTSPLIQSEDSGSTKKPPNIS